jgi:hypothetical protein
LRFSNTSAFGVVDVARAEAQDFEDAATWLPQTLQQQAVTV